MAKRPEDAQEAWQIADMLPRGSYALSQTGGKLRETGGAGLEAWERRQDGL